MLPENAMPELKVPAEFINVIDKTGYGKSLNEKLRISLAIGLFIEQSVTLERASELAGKPLADFIELLNSKKIPWMEYTQDHVDEDNFAISKYLGADSHE